MVTVRAYWERRVRRGAMWLDLTIPGWYRNIDLVKLDVGSGCSCIVGQLKQLTNEENADAFTDVVLSVVPDARDFGVSVLPGKGTFDEDLPSSPFLQWLFLMRPVHWTSHSVRYFSNWTSHSVRYFSILTRLWTVEINERLLNYEHGRVEPVLSQVSRRRRQQLTAKDISALEEEFCCGK